MGDVVDHAKVLHHPQHLAIRAYRPGKRVDVVTSFEDDDLMAASTEQRSQCLADRAVANDRNVIDLVGGSVVTGGQPALATGWWPQMLIES